MRTLLKATLLAVFLSIAFESFAQTPAIVLRYANRKVINNGMSWTYDLEAKGNATYGGADGQWIAMNVRTNLQLPPGVTITSGTTIGAPGHTISSGFQVLVQGTPPPGYTGYGITLERADLGTELSNTDFAVIGSVTVNFSGPVEQGTNAVPRVIPNNAGSMWGNLAQEELLRPFEFVDLSFPLPVKLVSFNATKESSQTQLSWVTSEEVNSERFDIQRSRDGKVWKTIGTQAGSGNSAVEKTYSFQDASPLSGTNLYRLEMIDKDGTSAFSRIQSVTFEGGQVNNVYPNPVSDRIHIQSVDLKTIKSVKMYNALGVEVAQADREFEKGVDVKNLAAGIYIVKITDVNDEVSDQKVVIVK